MVHMVLLLDVLKVKSYGSQSQIFLVAVQVFLRDESYGAYGSLVCGSQSHISWFYGQILQVAESGRNPMVRTVLLMGFSKSNLMVLKVKYYLCLCHHDLTLRTIRFDFDLRSNIDSRSNITCVCAISSQGGTDTSTI